MERRSRKMKTRDLTILSLILTIETAMQIINNPIVSFLKIYFIALLIFSFTTEPNKFAIYFLIYESIREVITTAYFYETYRGILKIILPIEFNRVDPLTFFIILVLWIPGPNLIQLVGAKQTIKRLKIREKIPF